MIRTNQIDIKKLCVLAERAMCELVALNGDHITDSKQVIEGLRNLIERVESNECVCCGKGKTTLMVIRVCDTCGSEYAGQDEMEMSNELRGLRE